MNLEYVAPKTFITVQKHILNIQDIYKVPVALTLSLSFKDKKVMKQIPKLYVGIRTVRKLRHTFEGGGWTAVGRKWGGGVTGTM